MRKDSIIRFLNALGVMDGEMNVTDVWVNIPCLMAPWMHASGSDERPSFGISINDQGQSSYFCFGCTPEGRSLQWLLHNLWLMTGKYPYEAGVIFAREEIWHDVDETDWVPRETFDKPSKIITEPLPYPVLSLYPLLQGSSHHEAKMCREWMDSVRGIPEYIQNMCMVRYDVGNKGIVFPLTGKDLRVSLLRFRSRERKSVFTISPKVVSMEWYTFPKLKESGAWFGLGMIDWDKPVTLVEGEFDRMRLMALGELNVMASCTSSVTDAQIDQCVEAGVLILGYDADKSGWRAHKRIIERVRGSAIIWILDWALVGVKDAGDLKNKEQMLEVYDQAALVS